MTEQYLKGLQKKALRGFLKTVLESKGYRLQLEAEMKERLKGENVAL